MASVTLQRVIVVRLCVCVCVRVSVRVCVFVCVSKKVFSRAVDIRCRYMDKYLPIVQMRSSPTQQQLSRSLINAHRQTSSLPRKCILSPVLGPMVAKNLLSEGSYVVWRTNMMTAMDAHGVILVAGKSNGARGLKVQVFCHYTRKMHTSRARLPKKLTFEPGDYV